MPVLRLGWCDHYCIIYETVNKIQVGVNSRDQLEKRFDELAISPDDRAKILQLFDYGKMTESEIREQLVTIRPYMADVIDTWTNSPMQTFSLTSVGMAIGHANIKRLVGEFANLGIWIN